MKILITCPPMIGIKDQVLDRFLALGLEPVFATVVQTLSEAELIELVPQFDGWIIGDDPATRTVLAAGRAGRLKAAVKWGVGIDNVDFDACHDLGIEITHTPGMFGQEVADIAISFLIGLARHTYRIDREVRQGNWPKYRGVSLAAKRIALVGCGDIGFQVLRRLDVMGCEVCVYDPFVEQDKLGGFNCRTENWPEGLEQCDFVIFTCALTESTKGMFGEAEIARCRPGVNVVNVSRGGLIDQAALLAALESGHVAGAALDVFEVEPMNDARLQALPNCVFG